MEQTPKDPLEQDLTAEVMEIHGGEIETLQADQVHMHLGGAQKIEATDVFMQQSAVALVEAGHVDVQQSAVIAVRGETVTTARTAALSVVADEVQQEDCRSGVVIARSADLQGSSTLVLLAGQTNGPVEALLDTRGALLAGLVAGTAIGMVLFAGSLIIRRR